MKNKFIRCLAAVSLVSLLLTGCVENKKPDETTPSSLQPQYTTHTTDPSGDQTFPTDPPPTDPPPTEPPPSVDPVKVLSSGRWKTYPQFVSLGGGLILASRNYYDGGKGIVNSMELIDVYEDEIVASLDNDSTREPVLQRFHDGAIVMADTKTKTFFVYDQSLKQTASFSAPQVDGFFSHDRKFYFYVEGNVLYRMDVASGNRGRMTLEQDLRLERLVSIHDSKTLLVAKVYLSHYTDSVGIAVIDGDTGKLRLLTDDLEHVWLSGDSFYGMMMDETLRGYDVYFGSLAGGEVKKITVDDLGGDRYGYSVLPGSHYLLRRLAPDEGERNTTIYDLANGGKGADLKQYGFEHAAEASIYLKDEQLILGLCPDGFYFELVRIDPKVLSYEGSLEMTTADWTERVEKAVYENYLEQVQGDPLPDSLADVRTQADALEEKYGVHIRIGAQTEGVCAMSGYTVAADGDAQRIKAALDTLDKALVKYPADMFKQFRNEAREGGLYFSFTGKITNKIPTVGFAKWFRDRYELVLDISADGLEQTIHHEIWHAIEMRISTDNFNTKKWNACNPGGFSYYGRYDSGYESLTKWTYTGGGGTGSYFVDPYSRINGREDRARIFEMVMSTDAGELMKASALQDKLEVMSSVLRQHFDDDGWTNVLWEKYL